MLGQIPTQLGQALESQKTMVFLHGPDFESGYHKGYESYLERFKGKPFTDHDIAHFLSNIACDVFHSGVYNAGFNLGWSAALHADCPQPIQVMWLVQGEA